MWTCAALILFFFGSAAHVQSLIQKGRLEEAYQEVRKLLVSAPSDLELLNLQGIVEAQRGNVSAAESSFQQALAIAPGSVSLWANLARLQQQSGLAERAFESWRRLAALDPSNSEAHYQLAYLSIHKGDSSAALAHLAKLSPAAREKPQVLVIKVAAGDNDGDVKALENHPALTSEDVMGILPLLAKQRRDRTSLVLLEALRRRGLAQRPSLDALAALYEKQKKYGEARGVLEQAAQLEGKVDVPLLMALSRLAWQQRDHQAVLSYLGQARQLEPENAAVHFFFGMTAVALDLPVEAKKSLGKAVELDPENAYAHYAYGAVLAQERDATPSIRHFEEYVKRRPEDVRGRFALAVAYFLANLFDEAKARLTPLTADKQTAAGAHYFLGRIARRQGQLQEAERELNSSLGMLADQTDVLAELGAVYLSLDKRELAEQRLARALQIDPDHYNANTRLLALYQRLDDPRAARQAARVEEVKRRRSEKEQALWRTLEIRPY